MIRANAALTRQAQEMFHRHLLGCFSWEDVMFAPAERTEKAHPVFNERGRKRRGESPEGKYRQIIAMEFGIWQLRIEGPVEHPPLGWVMLDGRGEIEGPLDPAVWDKIGQHIKTKQEEFQNVA